MVWGMLIANFARHHERPFHEIENIKWPFMVLFFILAGASLHADGLEQLWPIFCLYLSLCTCARLVGGWVGGRLAGLPAAERRLIGAARMPQAGVAVGMVLVAGGHFPEFRLQILSLTIMTTIIFELLSPFLTQIALERTGSR
jgi:Kef-type K+ transport system membrane component KefB